MSYPNAIEVCRADLFTKVVELRNRYPGVLVDKVIRVRELYNWFIANSDGTEPIPNIAVNLSTLKMLNLRNTTSNLIRYP